MRFILFHVRQLLLLSFLQLTLAVPHLAQLVERDQVGLVVDILELFQASAFCSNVLNLHDVTSTVTSSGPVSQETVTVSPAACTKTLTASTSTTIQTVLASASTITYSTTLPA